MLEPFEDWANSTILIQTPTVTGVDESGRPVYGSPTVHYNTVGWVWLLSASEQLICDRIGNPSTHRVVLDPDNVTGDISPEDQCFIDGEEFALHRADNIFQEDEVLVFTAERKR